MLLRISGESLCVTEETWRDSSQWYANELLGKRLSNKVTLYLELIPKLNHGMLGCIYPVDRKRYPREFLVQLNTTARKTRGQLTSLAHEMVHLRQLARAEFKVLDNRITARWKSRTFDLDGAYEKQPWEVEAYHLESILYKGYAAYAKGKK